MKCRLMWHSYSEGPRIVRTLGRTRGRVRGQTGRQVILLLSFFNLDSQEDWIFFILANSAIRDEMPP